ncbi:NAD-dependent epimerase/dehydratase family protein [Pseudovibrio sp. Tun.PSC04-5.I4]|uniref:NAD-dependent epimerase/dehydratase family protein n=1 Tax=Pseudovibrio sp. Tun.PSC04-5.I4 TaxID=1798213 RepID=UPI000880C554|nr:NAD-dependent epimerase/dehydratase family protein [Pseudovibrio sp. Tun.PSC04-5.I4]SDR18613.1 Nucleoside-diphosphate-sugar epimerase [Pseudovibrio sp. Tun.PSC04-5.I4]
MRLLILGAGYSARHFVKMYGTEFSWIGGTTRTEEKTTELKSCGIHPIVFDGTTASDELLEALSTATHILVSAAPTADGDPLLNAARDAVAKAKPKVICYLSTIGVYGDHKGRWITENADCNPTSTRSKQRLVAEKEWLAFSKETDIPVNILRLAGIYGHGQNALCNLDKGTARRIIKEGQVFNRIHVTDIAGAIQQVFEDNASGIFNVCDDAPCPPEDVVEHAARLMGVEPPPAIAFEDADLSPMAITFYGEVKRTSNAKLKGSLGYKFKFPTYREALDHMWKNGWS